MTFKTTHVGSLPRTGSIQEIIKMQIDTGIEEVNDGEFRRSIYFGNVTNLKGFTQGVYPVEFSAGDLFMSPLVTGPIQPPEIPLAAKEVSATRFYLSEMGVQRRVKITVPSVSMMLAFYPPQGVEGYPRATYISDILEILKGEARAAFQAGADTVQFDAPTLLLAQTFYQDLKELVSLDNELIDNVKGLGTTMVHGCFGNGWNTQISTTVRYASLVPDLLGLHSDIIGPLEVWDGIRMGSELDAFRDSGKRFAIGIVSVKSRNVEPVEVLKGRYEMCKNVLGDDVIVSPGCGFASAPETIHSLEGTKRKLSNLCKAVAVLD